MDINNDVINRLSSLKCDVTSDDTWALTFCINKTQNYVYNFCNISEIPDGLYENFVDMIVGEFLLYKSAIGEISSTDAASDIASVTEGDTTVSFVSGKISADKKLEILVDHFLTERTPELVKFRKLKW